MAHMGLVKSWAIGIETMVFDKLFHKSLVTLALPEQCMLAIYRYFREGKHVRRFHINVMLWINVDNAFYRNFLFTEFNGLHGSLIMIIFTRCCFDRLK